MPFVTGWFTSTKSLRTIPAKGVNTRTVASSSHTSRPVRETNADCSAPTGSMVNAANCGELVAMITVSPLTLASGTSAGSFPELQPVNRINTARSVIETRKLKLRQEVGRVVAQGGSGEGALP